MLEVLERGGVFEPRHSESFLFLLHFILEISVRLVNYLTQSVAADTDNHPRLVNLLNSESLGVY